MKELMKTEFRGAELLGFQDDDGTVFVALKPIVEAMGLNWSGQEQRVKRNRVLSEGTCVTHIPSGRGGTQETLCLKLEHLDGWLFTINSSRIKDETIRERVEAFQRECFQVLFEHFSRRGSDRLRQIHEMLSLNLRLVDEARLIWGDAVAQLCGERGRCPSFPA